MLTDSLLVQVKEGAMQAKAALEAEADYDRYGTNDLDEAYYDAQAARYDALIASIDAMFTPVQVE